MVIAVDAMGGDIPVHAPVEAAVRAANDFEQEIILVGNRDQVVTELDKHTFPKKLIEVVHSSETVGMDESPALSLRQKKDSSIRVAVNLLQEEKVDAVVSAGNTIRAESCIRRVNAGAESDATDVHGAVDTVRTEQFLRQILASFNWIQDVLGTVDTIVAAASRCQIETSFVEVTTVNGASNAVVAGSPRGGCEDTAFHGVASVNRAILSVVAQT